MNRASLDHEVAALMGPLAFGASARAGQRVRQSSFASPSASVMPCCCSRPSRSITLAALSLPQVFSGSARGVSGTLPTLSQEETLS